MHEGSTGPMSQEVALPPKKETDKGMISQSQEVLDPKRKRNKKKDEDIEEAQKRKKLKRGTVIRSETGSYVIVDMLGKGGFGDVYLVEHKTTKRRFAMKTEPANAQKGCDRLKVEYDVLQVIAGLEPSKRTHFLEFIDRGCINGEFKYIVMTLVKECIDTIREKLLRGKDFSQSTAHRFAMQSIKALWHLHDIGYLHRDLKPANYAVGGEKDDVIYLIDFGIAREFYQKGTHELRIPREHVRFCGTMKFAPRTCLKNKDQSRKDDLESWIYTTLDVFYSKALSWGNSSKKEEVLLLKDTYFNNPETLCPELFKYVPNGYRKFLRYINYLQYYDIPDYEFIVKNLDSMITDNNINMNEPYDWAGKLDKPLPINIENSKMVQLKPKEVDAKSVRPTGSQMQPPPK